MGLSNLHIIHVRLYTFTHIHVYIKNTYTRHMYVLKNLHKIHVRIKDTYTRYMYMLKTHTQIHVYIKIHMQNRCMY